MGILDSYPHPYALLPPDVCEALEHDAVSWRWRLRGRAHRLACVHGDFHPWNLLFREGADFSVLDRSRGEWGEPADDVSAVGINYLFFGLRNAALESRRGVAEPFLAFRALVIGHPRWYPALTRRTREALFGFARALMADP
jgi:aminoglycoside phosphotransferase (APT) family kinase protein